ncbi:MAG TPA: tRNA modification GTPase [Tepidisphaeraceae bacterium]|nr:tRNA modification GTPase [Tepidisphaeraceae bacterium]
MAPADTIAAISSTVAPGARVVVRMSGAGSATIAQELGAPATNSASAVHVHLSFADLQVPAWVYQFRAPRSYTGEDIAEFHLPGSLILARMLLDELLKRGARLADPGEFTARAYFNGRLDLTAAEGVAATIAAGNEQELSAARQLLSGELARRLAPVMHLLADTLALVEVGIDFVEEDVSFLSTGEVETRLRGADQMLKQLLEDSTRFERLAHEPQVVLAGRPNAGKSTLLNALAGHERAVVSPVAGTTRDALSAEVSLSRGMIRLSDVAGIEDTQVGTTGPIEQQMHEHAHRALKAADLVVLVQDATDAGPPAQLPREPGLTVRSKLDLLGESGIPVTPDAPLAALHVSARTGEGLTELRNRLDEICFGSSGTSATIALNVRHVRAISDARIVLQRALEHPRNVGPEILALEIRESLDYLGGVLGRLTPDDVLGRIFAGFCIGK